MQYKNLELELSRLLAQEEIYWKQLSKQLWLKEGDQNTKYFHKFASCKRRNNYLPRLRDQNGDWVDGTAMQSEVMRYYENIFYFLCCGRRCYSKSTKSYYK